MSNISFVMGMFSYQKLLNRTVGTYFPFSMVKVSLSWKTLYLRLLSIKECDAIGPGLSLISMILPGQNILYEIRGEDKAN